MTGKSAYARVREKLAEQREADAGQPAAQGNCRYCDAPTEDEALRALGARCRRCYNQYLSLGYSGAEPPRQCAPAPWIAAARDVIEAFRAVRSTRAPAASADAAPALAALELASQARQQREGPGRMDEDAVNAALQAEASA